MLKNIAIVILFTLCIVLYFFLDQSRSKANKCELELEESKALNQEYLDRATNEAAANVVLTAKFNETKKQLEKCSANKQK